MLFIDFIPVNYCNRNIFLSISAEVLVRCLDISCIRLRRSSMLTISFYCNEKQ